MLTQMIKDTWSCWRYNKQQNKGFHIKRSKLGSLATKYHCGTTNDGTVPSIDQVKIYFRTFGNLLDQFLNHFTSYRDTEGDEF